MAQASSQKKRRSTRGASRKAEPQESHSTLKAYGFGVVSGLFIAFMLYLVTLPPEEEEPTTPTAVASAPSVPAPKYDFFEVLPSQKLTVDVDPAELPQRNSTSNKQLLLQAGSFRQADDAESRRAQLLLLGLNPAVEETNGSNGRWFRVVIGPFESRSAMNKARSLTAQQDIDTLLVQRAAP